MLRLVSAVISRREDRPLAPGDLHAALVDRGGRWVAPGVVAGFAERVDGLASTLTTDFNILVLGRSPEAMARAVNRLLELRGGIVIVEGDEIAYEVLLPIGGIMGRGSMADAAEAERELPRGARRPRVPASRPPLQPLVPVGGLPARRPAHPARRVGRQGLADPAPGAPSRPPSGARARAPRGPLSAADVGGGAAYVLAPTPSRRWVGAPRRPSSRCTGAGRRRSSAARGSGRPARGSRVPRRGRGTRRCGTGSPAGATGRRVCGAGAAGWRSRIVLGFSAAVMASAACGAQRAGRLAPAARGRVARHRCMRGPPEAGVGPRAGAGGPRALVRRARSGTVGDPV